MATMIEVFPIDNHQSLHTSERVLLDCRVGVLEHLHREWLRAILRHQPAPLRRVLDEFRDVVACDREHLCVNTQNGRRQRCPVAQESQAT